MISALRRRVRSNGADRGMSLTELVVTMMVMGVVVAATVTLTIGFQRTTAQNISRQDQIDMGRTAVESMSRTVRAAVKPAQLTSNCTLCTEDAFLQGQDFAVQFYANVDNPGNSVGPSRVTYAVSTTGATAGQLIETIQQPDDHLAGATGYAYCDATAVGASTDCTGRYRSRPIAFGVVSNASSPIFKYYDAAGLRMLPASGTSLSVAQLSRVLSIELTITILSENATKPAPTTYIQRIMLPNAQAVIRLSEETTP